jgi:hypothetical protein
MAKFICAQPANTYYLWQVEVMINNFIKHGINPNDMHILLSVQGERGLGWDILVNHYKDVNFFFYNDTRSDSCYIPSIYFNLMKQHLAEHPKLQEEVLFTHDSDIVFTKKPTLDSLFYKNKWFVADTHSYLDYDYIQSKDDVIYQQMCKIVGIDPLIPKIMGKNIGGAQYVVRNTTAKFWEKVENDSVALYKYFCEVEPYYVKKHESDYPIQKWTAGMWSYMWNGWLAGNEIIVDPMLDFVWSTDSVLNIEKHSILHNAGVTDTHVDMFYKGAYINSLPYNQILNIDTNRASSYYWNEVCETAKISPLTNKT